MDAVRFSPKTANCQMKDLTSFLDRRWHSSREAIQITDIEIAIRRGYVHSFDHNGDSCGLHSFRNRYRDLFRESFLHLKTSAEDLHDPA
jgi:hypothetical protein